MISARGYAVVAKNLARVLGNYPNLTTANAYGNFSGTLANSSDRIQLFMPEPVIGTNSTGSATTNTVRILVDEVAYADGGRWAEWADGGGSSLELIDPESDNALAPNWAASDETKKSEWTKVEFTGRVDLGGMESPGQLHVFLQDAGEALLDDVEVFILGSTNLVRNNGFESGLTGWTVQGTHEESILETREGYNNSRQSLRIRASARGDVGGNRVRTGLAQTLPNNAIATIRAKVRWLAGTPHILIRLRGNYLECPGVMTLPRRLGTPGAMNSRSVPNSAPAIHEVAHFPVLPAPSQDVTVTARISDPQGIARFVLSYRVDATGGTTGTLDMKDDGTGGDATAGDGLYSATIPGQGSGVMVAFHLQATDSATPSASVLFPNDAPTRECLVRFGEPQIAATAFGSYRYWMTAAGVNRWRVRGKQSNHPLDCTFVYGNYRVLYNAQTLYSGSPWHTPGFNGPTGSDAVCDYILRAPADDLLLGAEDFVVGSIGNTDNDASKLAEQSSYWIARKMGIPYNHRRFVFVYFNGVRRASSLYEDTQQPSSDVIAQYWPDDTDGPLHKIEDWFEFDDSGDNKSGNVDATLDQFLTLEGKKVARYRVCWRPRAVGAGEDPNDFTQLFKVVDALSSAGPEPYNTLLPEIVDIQNWLSVFAMQHIVGNWDAYGYNRGKNMYTYKPTRGKFHLLLWDIDFDLGSGSDGPTTDLFITNEPMIGRLYSNPYFRRMYLRICMEAADGPLRAEVFAPTLDAKLKGLIDNGGAPTSPSFIKDYVRDRRNYLLGLLPRTNFTVFGSAFIATNAPMITLTGAAPVSAESIYVNGQTYPTAWSVISSRPFFWSMRVPIDAGTNDLVIEARDRFGSVISNGVQRVTVVSSNTPVPAEGNVVISEIAYLPEQPDAGYVEIHNRSATTAFTLTGWRLSGVDFNFPQGAVLPPRSYLVIAKDHFTFGARFAFRVPVIGEFDGNLDPEGEVISLLRPGSAAGEMLVVDRVRYEANPPWPLSPAVDGVSLEVVDGAQDNSRSSNWRPGGTEWRFVSVTGRPGNTNFFLYLTSTGDAYVDDIKLVTGTQAEVGENLIPNGGFEESLSSAWTIGATHRESAISSSIKQSGGASLQIRANAAGSASTNGALYQTGLPVKTNETYTLSFWVRYGERPSGANLVARFNPGGTLGITQSLNRVFGSPGAPNVSAGTIAAYHPLWLNEISPFNSSGATDPQGERDPWVELYNAGTAPVDLADYRLSDSYGNLATWSFPAGSVIQGGERRLIWIDGDADVSNALDWHTPFRAQPTEGSIILSQIVSGQPRVVDYLNYSDLRSDESYGSFPDGQPFYRLAMSFPTPGAANNGASKPLAVRINEWMASNTGFILDLSDVPPAADDWFELFNPGRTDADLGGYYLTDSSQNRTQFRIPAGTIIPAGGYLLVWADNSPGQNSTNSADLHVNFQLARGGEELGLYGADGEVIDLVRFGTQTNNISEGRIPDGGATRVFFAQPTPRSANQLGGNNTPPTLARVGNKIMNERTRLTLDLSATDAEEETSQLVFSLDPGAPVGASITPQGRFVWRPSEAQGPGVFPVTFRVRDNGTPSLIAEESINITVREVNLPPVFADQRGRYVTVGDTLSFSTGVDLDQPAQAVLFRLESEAHAGLSVNPVTGVLTWKPTADQAGRSYTVVVSATDNGVPVLSSSASYIIFVSSADQSSIVVQASSEAGGIVLTWPSAPGDRFQVETKSDLAGQWVPLGNVITATGASSQARDTFGGLMKFYRITKL
ncbi:MAG: hypothetical protein FJ405_08770 [Verrucomicrobia bacterium]|nr:hypothetical protein [Verrucomicrobiota bacterium]